MFSSLFFKNVTLHVTPSFLSFLRGGSYSFMFSISLTVKENLILGAPLSLSPFPFLHISVNDLFFYITMFLFFRCTVLYCTVVSVLLGFPFYFLQILHYLLLSPKQCLFFTFCYVSFRRVFSLLSLFHPFRSPSTVFWFSFFSH